MSTETVVTTADGSTCSDCCGGGTPSCAGLPPAHPTGTWTVTNHTCCAGIDGVHGLVGYSSGDGAWHCTGQVGTFNCAGANNLTVAFAVTCSGDCYQVQNIPGVNFFGPGSPPCGGQVTTKVVCPGDADLTVTTGPLVVTIRNVHIASCFTCCCGTTDAVIDIVLTFPT